MRKIIYQALSFLLLVIALTLIRYPYSEFAAELIESWKQQARRGGLQVESGEVSLNFPLGIKVNSLAFTLPTIPSPFPFRADSVYLSADLTSLLSPKWILAEGLALPLTGAIDAYGGKINWSFSTRLLQDKSHNEIIGKDLDLSKHPWASEGRLRGLLSFDLQAGLIKQTLNSKSLNGKSGSLYVIDSGTLRIFLKNGSYAGGHRIAGLLSLPPAEDIKMEVLAEKKLHKVIIKQAHLFSSLGEAQLSGTLKVSDTLRLEEAEADITILLTAIGFAKFGPWLALAANAPSDSKARNFQLHISKTNPADRGSVKVSVAG